MNWFMVVVVDVQQLNWEKETHHVGRSSADKALLWLLLLLLTWVYLFISHQKTRSMCDHTIFVPSLSGWAVLGQLKERHNLFVNWSQNT